MYIKHKEASVFYNDIGSGPAVVLLHGFLENKEMWIPMMSHLTKNHRVITIDLLGHGKSDCLGYLHTMDIFAEAVLAIITALGIDKISVVGHSMGGYVGLAFAKAYPERIQALCLLNSTPEDDTRERKELRARANEMAKKQYSQLIRMSVKNLFDPKLKATFEPQIKIAVDAALQTPIQGYIAANSGMSDRPNSVDFWKSSSLKKGLILGQNDWIIDAEEHKKRLSKSCDLFKIVEGGHMLHITSLNKMLEQILLFLRN